MTRLTATLAPLLLLLSLPVAAADTAAPPSTAEPSLPDQGAAVASPPPVDVGVEVDAPESAAPLPSLPPPDDYAPKTEPAELAREGSMHDFVWSFVKSMLMLSFVLALVYLVLHKGVGKLVQRTQMGRRMRVVERISLDQRRALYLVEVDGKEVLLAASEGGVTAIDVKGGEERAQPATPAAPSVRFSTDLGKGARTPPVSGFADDGTPRAGAMPKSGKEGVEG